MLQVGFAVCPFVLVAAAETPCSIAYCYLPPSCLYSVGEERETAIETETETETDKETELERQIGKETETETEAGLKPAAVEVSTRLDRGETVRKGDRLKIETDAWGLLWVGGGPRKLQGDTLAVLRALQLQGWQLLLLPHFLWGASSPQQRAEALWRARRRALEQKM